MENAIQSTLETSLDSTLILTRLDLDTKRPLLGTNFKQGRIMARTVTIFLTVGSLGNGEKHGQIAALSISRIDRRLGSLPESSSFSQKYAKKLSSYLLVKWALCHCHLARRTHLCQMVYGRPQHDDMNELSLQRHRESIFQTMVL